MKHLIILVLAVLSLNQKIEAQVKNLPQLPSKISIHDHEIESWPLVIKIRTGKPCFYCEPDMRVSHLIFQDTQTMKVIKEITGIDFQMLATRSQPAESGETDKEYQKIMHAGSFGQHTLTWHIEAATYKAHNKHRYGRCSPYGYYFPEECFDLRTKTCQLIKSQIVKMRVHHGGRVNTYTEFTGSESKVIHEWEVNYDEQCSNNKL